VLKLKKNNSGAKRLTQYESKNRNIGRHPLGRQAILKLFLQNAFSKDKSV